MIHSSNKQQRGLTLIELMVSIALGIFMLSVASQYLVDSRVAYSEQSAQSTILDSGNYALDILARNIRTAGSKTPVDQGINNSTSNSRLLFAPCGGAAACTNDGQDGEPDQLAVLSSPGAGAVNCSGVAVPANVTQVANVFSIAGDPSNLDENGEEISSLYCESFRVIKNGNALNTTPIAGSRQPLVAGVDNMQLQYGVVGTVPGAVSANIVNYVNAETVLNTINPDNGSSLIDQVAAVRVVLLINTGYDDNTNRDFGEQTFYLLDADPIKKNDGNAWRLFASTTGMNSLQRTVINGVANLIPNN